MAHAAAHGRGRVRRHRPHGQPGRGLGGGAGPERSAAGARRQPERGGRRVTTPVAPDLALAASPGVAPTVRAVPTATYRLQLHAGFTFRDASELVPYLDELGIGYAYTSPYLRARSGSTHGYDVADPNALNPELGSPADYDRLATVLATHGMGQLVDVVPNHMGIGDPGNYRWLDVLENGPSSRYAPFFDINWNPLRSAIQDTNKLVLPILGDQYGNVLEAGQLRLLYDDGAFFVAYFDRRFPVAPDSYWRILQPALDDLEQAPGESDDAIEELRSIQRALRNLPPRDTTDPVAVADRAGEKEVVKRRLRELGQASEVICEALARAVARLNGTAGERSSFDTLDALLDEQSYRLAFWRVAAEEINYRRFFDITELAAVRMEDPTVFADTHKLLLQLVGEGRISGLRIDHPDGLRDPRAYLRELQHQCLAVRAAATPSVDGADGAQPVGQHPFYVVVEKILASDERLPTSWPVSGTTGYEYLNAVNGLFVNRANEGSLDTIYTRFLRDAIPRYRDLSNSSRKLVMLISLGSEVNELGYLLKRIASADRRHRDFTLNSLTFAVREVIAGLDVYRTYIDPATGRASSDDRLRIGRATAEAKRRNPRTDPSVFESVGDTLLFADADRELSELDRAYRLQFIARFQQTSGPVMAKGVEDTAFYLYNRLISLNEVGGAPDRFGTSLTAFHRFNQERARDWPTTLLTTSTHDTKRSADVRARINVLSELPATWRAALTRWSRLNGRKKINVEGRAAPDRNEEYLLYQTLLGVWPYDVEQPDSELVDRVVAFMLKAVKEAKLNTSWINPNDAYEHAVEQFVRSILDAAQPNPFLDDFADLRRRVAHFGLFNALSQTVLTMTSPGVPDVYQGNELWDLSLVDPDNRRPVDYRVRREHLRELRRRSRHDRLDALAAELLATRTDGRIKLFVTHRLLTLRRAHPELFGAAYSPLRVAGARVGHACAYARSDGERELIVVAPVLIAGLVRRELEAPIGEAVWRDTAVLLAGDAGHRYRDLFTGAQITSEPRRGRASLPLAQVLSAFPVAALVRES
ncbi:MAG: malto-oligosyltrehalose synthase [Chloroflexi bacterium]|nr:malto-oligosyltrehalose synthase [Chloroflexota bacterium]